MSYMRRREREGEREREYKKCRAKKLYSWKQGEETQLKVRSQVHVQIVTSLKVFPLQKSPRKIHP